MRRRRTGFTVICLGPLLIAGPVWADRSDTYGPATTQCTIGDPSIDELSGLVALADGDLLLVEDSTPDPLPGATSILMYRLDSACQLLGGGPQDFDQDPRDIEDLAFRDDTLWFADIGDNAENRPNVAVISVGYDPADPQADVGAPQVFRLGYPDGPHDAEALLLAPDGSPYIVTKDVLGRSGVYRPTGPLDPAAEVRMEKVADLEFTMTGTPGGPVGRGGQLLVTGGAVAADGGRIALRTYTDAYVWRLSGNDMAGALQANPMAIIALPDAPQGEAISFAADSRSLLLGGEGVNSVITAVPATPDVAQRQPEASATTESETGFGSAEPASPDSASNNVTAGLIAVGMIAVLAGVTWFVRRMRRKAS
ncbi:MAG: hypothetical protein H0U15_05950 [Geodermatophilaceae bacterium]|nr:hypothetical protein [Geodermatophilaceae bacterium]